MVCDRVNYLQVLQNLLHPIPWTGQSLFVCLCTSVPPPVPPPGGGRRRRGVVYGKLFDGQGAEATDY